MNDKEKLAMLGAALAGGAYAKSQFDDDAANLTPSQIIQDAMNGNMPEHDNNNPFVADPHTGGVDGLCVRMGLEPGTPEAFDMLSTFAQPYELTSTDLSIDTSFDSDSDETPISAHAMGMLEDMHLDALQKAADAEASGNYATASMLRHHAADIDHTMHGNHGNW